LDEAEGIDIRVAAAYRALEDGHFFEQGRLAGDGADALHRAAVLGLNGAEDAAGEIGIGDQVGVEAGDVHVGLGQDHLRVVDEGVEKGPGGIHPFQGFEMGGIGADGRRQGGAQTVPTGERVAGLHPGKDPGDGAELLDGGGGAPLGRAGP